MKIFISVELIKHMKKTNICVFLLLLTVLSHQTVFAQFLSEFELSELNNKNGFIIKGENEGDLSGFSVSSAGDVNGDGIDDLIIGAFGADPGGESSAGKSYVIFGNRNGFSNPLNLSTLNGENGFVINGEDTDDFSGISISSAGDVNGDEIDDLIIGASGADPGAVSRAGKSYVIFGSRIKFPHPFSLSTLNSRNGFAIHGQHHSDFSGRSVNSAGDFNGDGVDDLIIGAHGANPGVGANTGKSYVIFGSDEENGLPHPFDLFHINPQNGFVINGEDAGDDSGISVNSAGDVNGDGIDDLIIGADGADPDGKLNAGKSYVIFGRTEPLTSPFNLSELNSQDQDGFVIKGENEFDNSGVSVSSAGDFNGDGIDDLIIGANGAGLIGQPDIGKIYVIFGSDHELTNQFNLSNVNGLNGFVINGENAGDNSGISVNYAGDVNGDGVDDLIIGADGADPDGKSNAGKSYVVFGKNGCLPSSLNLSNLDGNNGFTINGENEGDNSGNSVNSAGDVNGDEIDDLIIGAYTADPNGASGAGKSYVVFGSKSDIIFESAFDCN